MGSGASVNSFFGITTMIISIPTGAKMFNWLFTMYRGRIRFELPMLWTIAFMLTFVLGGMTGVLLAVPPADFVLHNSLFLIAHFHNVIIGGVLFGLLAGITYWFPKAFGYKLDPFWGKCSFWFWVIGFYFAFMPLYVLGLMGVTRRVSHFEDPSLQIWFVIAAFGAALIALGIACFIIQLIVSFIRRESLRDTTGDPWNGRTLEWSTASPPPAYNFAFTPIIRDSDAWHDMKANQYARPKEGFIPIHMPSNTWAGFVIAAVVRLAQGSATVALTTAAALVQPVVLGNPEYNPVELAAIVLALAAGSVFAGHVNDSGFWLVSRFFQMDTKTTLKTWTVGQALVGIVGFVLALAIYLIAAPF
jgi:cytochrome o ubiquinol oxidase subunit 1